MSSSCTASSGVAEPDAPPVVAEALRPHQGEVVDAEEALGLPDRLLGGLHREGVGAAPAVTGEVDHPRGERREQQVDVLGPDAPEVEAVRQRDDVAGEAVAADVGGLPDLGAGRRAAEGVVERPALRGAAPVALAVRADDEERLLERDAGTAVTFERGDQVDLAEVVVVLDVQSEEPFVAGKRAADHDATEALRAPFGLPHEQQAGMRQRGELLPEMRLQGRGEQASTQNVAAPRPSVLDEQPVVDPARARRERLAAGARHHSAEGPTRRRVPPGVRSLPPSQGSHSVRPALHAGRASPAAACDRITT